MDRSELIVPSFADLPKGWCAMRVRDNDFVYGPPEATTLVREMHERYSRAVSALEFLTGCCDGRCKHAIEAAAVIEDYNKHHPPDPEF